MNRRHLHRGSSTLALPRLLQLHQIPPPPAHSRLSLSLHFHPAEAHLADLDSSFDICCNTVETSSPDTGLLRARSCSSNRCGPAPPSHWHHFWRHTYQVTFCVDTHQRRLGPTKRRPRRPHTHQNGTVGRCPRSSTVLPNAARNRACRISTHTPTPPTRHLRHDGSTKTLHVPRYKSIFSPQGTSQ